MLQAAIYARFSTDLQHERSIDDQVALCRDYASRNGLAVVSVFSDRARSGASVFGRDGLLNLMDAARAGAFRVVIVEALDRLSRDQEDLPGLWKRLTFLGVEIRAVHEGRADAIQIGVRGLVGALFLQDLAHKVRRGMSGRVREGLSAGGRAYAYRPVPGKPGELVIVEEEARIVRRIFDAYVAGATPREIAGRLNRDGVPPPRGKWWNASTINGSKERGTGILHCDLYAGRIVWNKVRMLKNPETGRRISRPNPREEWQPTAAPQLAIVDPDTFAAAGRRKATRSHEGAVKARQPRHLLSGLLRCSRCGGGMSIAGRWRGKVRVGCSRRKESRTCGNSRTFDLASIESRVIDGLKTHLDDPRLIAEYVTTFNAERRRLAAASAGQRHRRERRLEQVEREIGRAVEWIVSGSADPATLGPKLKVLELEKRTLQGEIAAERKGAEIVVLHPTAIARYREQVENLHAALSTGGGIERAGEVAAFRALVDSVVIDADAEGTQLNLRGRLAELTGAPAFPGGIGVGGIGGSGGGT